MKKLLKNRRLLLLLMAVIVVILFFFLTKDRQRKLPYRVSGNELLEIKERCKNLANTKLEELNSYGIAFHELDGYGYSEYRGTCYAEFIRNFDDWDAKVLYDTVEEKELTTRKWPQDLEWYDSDFDHMILGRSKILDFRAPW